MAIGIGVKSDPVEYRYSYEWLFELMRRQGVTLLQLGSFFELYDLPEEYFAELRSLAHTYGIRIKSVFTAHRELGGFFTGNIRLEQVARKNFETLIRAASVLGADFVGSNPGAVYRDRPEEKSRGLERYAAHMKELSHLAKELGLKGLTVEPMSCLAEPPSTPEEVRSLMTLLGDYHAKHQESTVPFYLCGDVSHGVMDRDFKLVHGNLELFELGIPWMCEFHFKNTDAVFGSTFGFGPEERKQGIVKVEEVVAIARRNATAWPVQDVVGYLEIGGPKIGRDYSDHLLEKQLTESLSHIQSVLAMEDSAEY